MQNAAQKLELDTLQERFAGGCVRGSVVRAHIDWVRDHRDRSEIIEFFEAVPPSMRTVLSAAWYPFADAIEVDRIIMNWFGHGELRFLEEIGAYAAKQEARGSGVHAFFRRLASLHRQLHNFGNAVYREGSPAHGRMIHTAYVSYSPLYCASAIGFYRECIRLHAGGRAEVTETSCQCRGEESCTFDLAWE
jgi:hypothetical protein